MRRFTPAIVSAFMLSGCAVLSSAPPQVRMDREIVADNDQTTFDATCTPNQSNDNASINRTVDGALMLINNYVLMYRCQADRAAEGKQYFDVPGFVTAAGAATAAALGAGPNIAIAAGATGAVMARGKEYYDPTAKSVILNDALSAFLCIKNEAVGIDAYTLEAISQLQGATGETERKPDQPVAGAGTTHSGHDEPEDNSSITVTSERQYFDMVQSALINTERVVARRLAIAGKAFDMDGIVAEIEKAAEKVRKTEEEAKDPATQGQAVLDTPTTKPGQTDTEKGQADDAKGKLVAIGASNIGTTVIKLKTLQPKLQQCIVRAKA